MESDAVLGTVSLEVSNLSASRAEDIVQQIKRMESVNGLEQEAFRGANCLSSCGPSCQRKNWA